MSATALLTVSAYGLAAFACLLLSWFTRRSLGRMDAVILSLSFIATWAFSNSLGLTFGWDIVKQTYWATDMLMVALVMSLWWKSTDDWKFWVGLVLLTKLIFHVTYWSNGWPIDYTLMLNIAYSFEIVIVSLVGGRIVANRLFGSGPRYRRVHHWSMPNGQRSPSETTGARR